MTAKHENALLIGAAGLLVAVAGSAFATTPAERVAAAKAELQDALAAQQQAVRQVEMDRLVDKATVDAARNTFFQDGPARVVVKPGKGFTMTDDSGANSLNISFISQFRYVLNLQDDFDGTPNVDGTTEGFEWRRNRLFFKGRMRDKFTYVISFDVLSGANPRLIDSFFNYKINDDWTFTAGQFRPPLSNECLIGYAKQQAVEISSNGAAHGALARTQGVMVTYQQPNYRVRLSYNDGFAQWNTDWNSGANQGAVTGRIDWMAVGEDWKAFTAFTSPRDQAQGLQLGVAGHYQWGDVGDAATPTNGLKNSPDVFEWTADAQWQGGGYNLYASILGRHTEPNLIGISSTDDYAYMVMGGVYLTDDVELFGRWEYLDYDAMSNEPHIVTVGVNKYLYGVTNKLSADVGFATDTVPLGIASDRTGMEVDAAGKDGQVFLRLQWQIHI